MKRTLSILVLLISAISIHAQGIYVYKTDGTKLRLLNAEVDSIVAFECENSILNGHEVVDLGLSVKWATCNVGASLPYEYGGYYAWGETSEKTEYSRDTYKFYNKSQHEYTYILDDITGTSYDVARVKWGGTWRMPTKKEMEELVKKCNWKWTTYNDVHGYLVTSSNGKSIFLPAAGYYDKEIERADKSGSYLTSTNYETGKYDSQIYYLPFYDVKKQITTGACYFGNSVRPVTD